MPLHADERPGVQSTCAYLSYLEMDDRKSPDPESLESLHFPLLLTLVACMAGVGAGQRRTAVSGPVFDSRPKAGVTSGHAGARDRVCLLMQA